VEVVFSPQAFDVGQRVSGRPSSTEARRLVLQKTRFLVFYEVTAAQVVVLRVWHPAQRPPAGVP